jgi:predicted DNA-binding transcriptional regulator AlpA
MEIIGQTFSGSAASKPRTVIVEVRRKRLAKTGLIPPQRAGACLVKGKSELMASTHEGARREKNNDTSLQELIRVKDTPGYIGVSSSTYHNYRNCNSKYFDEHFPRLVVLSQQCKGHLKRELDAWLECKKVNVAGLGGDNG